MKDLKDLKGLTICDIEHLYATNKLQDGGTQSTKRAVSDTPDSRRGSSAETSVLSSLHNE